MGRELNVGAAREPLYSRGCRYKEIHLGIETLHHCGVLSVVSAVVLKSVVLAHRRVSLRSAVSVASGETVISL